jgi:hypothetical protein
MKYLTPLLSVAAALYVLWVLVVAVQGLQPLKFLLVGA